MANKAPIIPMRKASHKVTIAQPAEREKAKQKLKHGFSGADFITGDRNQSSEDSVDSRENVDFSVVLDVGHDESDDTWSEVQNSWFTRG